MIITSLLLIAGAAAMLVLGLWQSSSTLLSGSIAMSLFAAIVLVIGARRGTVTGPPQPEPPGGTGEPAVTAGRGRPAAPPAQAPARAAAPPNPTVTIPAQGSSAPGNPARGAPVHAGQLATASPPPTQAQPPREQAGDYVEDEDPPDEPAPQQVSSADAARVGRMLTEVLVVDGRPRYHLPGCVHLLGRENEPLPVAEAMEIGFTPCSLCEPDSALLADARRV